MASKDKKVVMLAFLQKDIDRMASPRQLDRCWNPGLSRKLGYRLQALLKLFFAVLGQAESGVDGEEVKRGPGRRERDRLSGGLGTRRLAFNAAEDAGEWRGRLASSQGWVRFTLAHNPVLIGSRCAIGVVRPPPTAASRCRCLHTSMHTLTGRRGGERYRRDTRELTGGSKPALVSIPRLLAARQTCRAAFGSVAPESLVHSPQERLGSGHVEGTGEEEALPVVAVLVLERGELAGLFDALGEPGSTAPCRAGRASGSASPPHRCCSALR